MRALSKDRDDRYPDCAAFAEALDASVTSRRKAVTERHLADFLAGLAALPVTRTDVAKPGTEGDHEVPEESLRAYAVATGHEVDGGEAEAEVPSDAASGGGANLHELPTNFMPAVSTPVAKAPAAASPEAQSSVVQTPAPPTPEARAPARRTPTPAPTATKDAGWRFPLLLVIGLVVVGAIVGVAFGLITR